MITKSRLFTGCIALIASALTGFGGLLGVDHYGVQLGYGKIWFSGGPNIDGLGTGVGINKNILKNSQVGIDLNGGATYARLSNASWRVREQAVGAGVTIFVNEDGARPFFNADIGWAFLRERFQGMSFRDDTLYTSLGGGIEIPFSENTSLTPFLSWTYFDDFSSSGWNGGLRLHHWYSEKFGIGTSVSTSDGPHDSISVVFAFTGKF